MTAELPKDTTRFAWSLVAAAITLMVSVALLRGLASGHVDDVFTGAEANLRLATLPILLLGLPLLTALRRLNILNGLSLVAGALIIGFVATGVVVLLMVTNAAAGPYVSLLMAAGGGVAGGASALIGWLVWRLWPLPKSERPTPAAAAQETEAIQPAKATKPCPTIQKP